MNLLSDMESLAKVDASKAAEIQKISKMTAWNACVITDLEHTPYLIRYLSF